MPGTCVGEWSRRGCEGVAVLQCCCVDVSVAVLQFCCVLLCCSAAMCCCCCYNAEMMRVRAITPRVTRRGIWGISLGQDLAQHM